MKSSDKNIIKYNIISYCWDSGKFNVYDRESIITIKSCKKDAFILMLEICQKLSLTFIWIDVVCVSNNPEVCKIQLAEMGEYYERAQKCLVFPDGLNYYNHPIHLTGNIGKWYDRSWTVQESYYTLNKKIFVYIISHNLLNFMCKYNNNVKYNLIKHLEIPLNCKLPQNMCIITVYESHHAHFCNTFINVVNNFYRIFNKYNIDIDNDKEYLFELIEKENFAKYYANIQLKECEVKFTELLKPMNIVTVIRESLYRDCKKIQDKIYGIMTILKISLNTDYDIEMNSLIHETLLHLDSYHLLCFILADLFDDSLLNCNIQEFYVKNSCFPYYTNTNTEKRIKKYFYDIEIFQPIDIITYTIYSGLDIYTFTTNVIIKHLKQIHKICKNNNSTHICQYNIKFLTDISIEIPAEGYTYTDNMTTSKLLYICNSFDVLKIQNINESKKSKNKDYRHIFIVIHQNTNNNKWYKIGILHINPYYLYKKKINIFPKLNSSNIWKKERISIA